MAQARELVNGHRVIRVELGIHLGDKEILPEIEEKIAGMGHASRPDLAAGWFGAHLVANRKMFLAGDKAKAKELLDRALAINPKGIDPNYFYGEYLVETGKPSEAIAYLERALAAPARPGREIADAGRRDEAKALLDKVRAQVASR